MVEDMTFYNSDRGITRARTWYHKNGDMKACRVRMRIGILGARDNKKTILYCKMYKILHEEERHGK
jgi:hypothetical protein